MHPASLASQAGSQGCGYPKSKPEVYKAPRKKLYNAHPQGAGGTMGTGSMA